LGGRALATLPCERRVGYRFGFDGWDCWYGSAIVHDRGVSAFAVQRHVTGV